MTCRVSMRRVGSARVEVAIARRAMTGLTMTKKFGLVQDKNPVGHVALTVVSAADAWCQ